MECIRVLLAGDSTQESTRLETLLRSQADIDIVGQVGPARDIAEASLRTRADLVLLHGSDPDAVVEAVSHLVAGHPGIKILAVLPVCGESTAARILEHGASGAMAAADEYAQGVRAIRHIRSGELWGSRALLSKVAQAAIRHAMEAECRARALDSLTDRERQVVDLLRAGASNKEIAVRLEISDKTVKTHLQNIFAKLQIRRRQMIPTNPSQ